MTGMAPRPYEKRARAVTQAATAERIVRAALDLGEELESIDLTLPQIALRAQTSVQTVLRHFGSRDGLIAAAIEAGQAEVAAERRAPTGDLDASLDLLVDHYERRGRMVLKMLSRHDPESAAVTTPGKAMHRSWVEEVFEAWMPSEAGDRDEMVDMLVVVTDVYAWSLLRLDRGLSRDATRARMGRMVRLLTAGSVSAAGHPGDDPSTERGA